MTSNVDLQVALLREFLSTDVTAEWFFSCMYSHMDLQSILVGKLFVAIRTLERFFSCLTKYWERVDGVIDSN